MAISPLNSVPKKDPGDRRVIADFSFPEGSSVNHGIPKDYYLGDQIDLSYPSVDSLALLLKQLGPGSHIFKKDLRRAYRQFKVDPGDIHLCGYMWDGAVYLDLALVMGARSAAFLCQRVTNAFSFILKKSEVNVINYLDDICCVSHPSRSMEEFKLVTETMENLGLLESVEKSVPPSCNVEFLGVLFDSNAQTMSVTESRLVEIHDLIDHWLSRKRASKRDLQSLVGKLIFVSKCVLSSRVFISRILAVLRSLRSQHHRFKINAEFRKDLKWWKTFLQQFNGTSYIPDMIWAKVDSSMSTDACLQGIGGWSGDRFFSEEFPQAILEKSFHINVLELMAIMVGLRLWSSQFKNSRIQLYCDNEACVHVINSGRSKDKNMLRILREIVFICAMDNFQIKAIHLPGVSNRIADCLSRVCRDKSQKLQSVIGKDWVKCEVSEGLFEPSDRW